MNKKNLIHSFEIDVKLIVYCRTSNVWFTQLRINTIDLKTASHQSLSPWNVSCTNITTVKINFDQIWNFRPVNFQHFWFVKCENMLLSQELPEIPMQKIKKNDEIGLQSCELYFIQSHRVPQWPAGQGTIASTRKCSEFFFSKFQFEVFYFHLGFHLCRNVWRLCGPNQPAFAAIGRVTLHRVASEQLFPMLNIYNNNL